MKIGVLTYWTSQDNYGQVLQCYALQKFLKNNGHDVILIRYKPIDIKKNSIWIRIIRLCQKSFSYFVSLNKLLYLFSSKRKIIKRKEAYEKKLIEQNKELNKIRDFETFKSNNISCSDVLYRTIDDLRNNPPNVDVLIVGSDQVWHDSYENKNTDGWFLLFGDERQKRISYAASIGRDLTKEELAIFLKKITYFKAIGVREKTTKALCDNNGFGNKCEVNLDPTMLLNKDNYLSLCSNVNKNIDSNFVFMYILNVKTKEDIYWEQIKEFLESRKLSFKIVCSSGYCQARNLLEEQNNSLMTINEWIYNISIARYIITTSYHGMIFSIIMRKQFLVIPLNNLYSSANVRIFDLLTDLGLQDRIYDNSKPFSEQIEKKINWDSINTILDDKIIMSKNFLLKNI